MNTNDEIKIIVTGDLCPLGIAEKMLSDGKASELFGNVMEELHDKDLSITNFEATMSSIGNPLVKIGPNLKVNPDIMQSLKDTSFDVYALANNHTRDFGDDAFLNTIANIEKHGIKTTGGGKNQEDSERPLRLTVKGIKISIIAVTMHNICCAENNQPGAAPLRPGAVTLKIVEEKKFSDLVIVIPHDGKEHIPFPSQRIRDNYHTFIDAGATAVIAHHPHIYQGIEHYKNGIIAYSLGNFLFPSRDPANAPEFWHKSYFLRLHCTKKGMKGLDIIPHSFSISEGKMSLMTGLEKKNFIEKIERLSVIASDAKLSSEYYDAATAKFTYYENQIRNFLKLKDAQDNKSEEYKKTSAYMHHILTTEEHWDVLESLARVAATGTEPKKFNDIETLME